MVGNMLRIGLTGGIAAGKSTVSARLRELGAALIDYDVLARQVVEPGGVGLRRIVDCFGADALTEQGELDRAWMARHVFSGHDAERARKRLDDIEHPLIYDAAGKIEGAIAADDPRSVVVHDIPLLAEVIDGIPFRFDHVVTVEAPEQLRVDRMVSTRGMTRKDALARIRHQSSVEQRRAIADAVIDSARPMECMLESVDMLYEQWLAES